MNDFQLHMYDMHHNNKYKYIIQHLLLLKNYKVIKCAYQIQLTNYVQSLNITNVNVYDNCVVLSLDRN